MKKAHVALIVFAVFLIAAVSVYIWQSSKSGSSLSYSNRLGMNGSSNPRAIKVCKEEEVCDDEESRKCRTELYKAGSDRGKECRQILMDCYKRSGLSDCAAKALYAYDSGMQRYNYEISITGDGSSFSTPEGALQSYNNYMRTCPELTIKANCFVA
jgi:hypothetical protein